MKGPRMMRNFHFSTVLQLPADKHSVTAAGYLADAADCRARPISDTILDTRCRGITNLRPVARPHCSQVSGCGGGVK